jgi:hypothetical protein
MAWVDCTDISPIEYVWDVMDQELTLFPSPLNYLIEVLDFLMGYDEYARTTNIGLRSQLGSINRPKNIIIRYVSFVFLSRLFV